MRYTADENIIATIKMRNNFCYPFKNDNFSDIVIAIFDFDLKLESRVKVWSKDDSYDYIRIKRYSKIVQHLARHFNYNGAGLSSPPPFLCSPKITPFSNSMISSNQQTVESVYPYSSSIIEFLFKN